MSSLYTIGHSTRTIDELIEVAQSSRTFRPWSTSALSRCRGGCRTSIANRWRRLYRLPESSIAGCQRWEDIARRSETTLPNLALRNDSFRNYADYMLTQEFQSGIDELLKLARRSRTAYMCAERVYFRCHRMLVSDWLVAHGHEVLHIDGMGPVKAHRLMQEARMVDGELVYRGDLLF